MSSGDPDQVKKAWEGQLTAIQSFEAIMDSAIEMEVDERAIHRANEFLAKFLNEWKRKRLTMNQ